MSDPRENDFGKKRPRLRKWHGILWGVLFFIFCFLGAKWVHDWETTRGRVAPTNRLVWNALSIQTGPFAGVFYWDYGHNQPNMIKRLNHLATSKYREPHRLVIPIVMPIFLLLVFPSTGLFMRPMRKRWRLLIGVLFVLGTGFWYLSAMVSIAMLS